MQYRKFGHLDWEASALGFGAMRLPTQDGNPFSSSVDKNESIRMIRHAIDFGVNYVDTAYTYHGGLSESIVGEALADGYRQKVKLATKSPVFRIKETAEFGSILDEQLKRLNTDHIDFYLLHTLNRAYWKNVVLKLNLLEEAQKALRSGKIAHLGFSFHDSLPIFKTILNYYENWEFCQIQYNYMDTINQAGTKGLKLAAEKGLAVIVMEPLLGGKLAIPPVQVEKIFQSAESRRSPADWALQWLWNQPEVSLVLSGMSSMEQVQQNLDSADRSGVGSLSNEELSVVRKARRLYEKLIPIPCTRCFYCMPCPHGLNIPRNIEIYNDGFLYEDTEQARRIFQQLKFINGEKALAGACQQCRECEKKCPQRIPISAWMPKINAVLAEGQPYPS